MHDAKSDICIYIYMNTNNRQEWTGLKARQNKPLISDKSSGNFPEDTGGKVTEQRRFQVTSLTGPLNGSMIQFIAPVNNFLLSLFRGRRLGAGWRGVADLRAPQLAARVLRGVGEEPEVCNHRGLSPHLSTESARGSKINVYVCENKIKWA